MNELDRMAREIVRQSRPAASAPRVSGGGNLTQQQFAPSTRVVDGKILRLFIPDHSPLDDDDFYLGDAPLGDSHDA